MESETGGKVVSETFAVDEARLETIMKRIAVKSATIQKMKFISSIFSAEMGNDVKEADMISFFLELAFSSFLKSGEVEKRLKALTEG